MMLIVALVFVVLGSGAIGPRTSAAKPAAARPATAPAPADKPPTPVATRAPLEVTPPSGEANDPEARDARRLNDLQTIASALHSFNEKRGGYPNTNDRVQTSCVYETLDRLCELAGEVGRSSLTDPRGSSFGYWYSSNGVTFTLYASLEGQATGSDACPSQVSFIRLPNVFCLNSHTQ